MPTIRHRAGVAAAIAAMSLLAACASSSRSATSGAATTTAATASTQPGGPNPNAPETNPAGDIPDNQVFVPYTGAGGFTVEVPEGWARTEASSAVTFTDNLNSIRLETVAAANAPTISSAQRDEVPAIKASSTSYTAGNVTSVGRRGGDAVLITYQADSAPNPVTGRRIRVAVERYEFWRSGTEAILTLSGPVGADNVDPWRIVSDSFGWN